MGKASAGAAGVGARVLLPRRFYALVAVVGNRSGRPPEPTSEVADPAGWQEAAHRMMADQIERRGIRDPATLRAMAQVPRHRFVPRRSWKVAYADGALPISEGQTISQPYIVAQMTEALGVEPGHRVLEIGTGSGYQTAVLAEAVGPTGDVFTIERHAGLAEQAQRVISELGYSNVHFRVGDGTLGWPEAAPFDGIIVTAAGPFLPRELRLQLDPVAGTLVIPMGSKVEQELFRFRWDRGRWTEEHLGPVAFVPLIGEHGWKQ